MRDTKLKNQLFEYCNDGFSLIYKLVNEDSETVPVRQVNKFRVVDDSTISEDKSTMIDWSLLEIKNETALKALSSYKTAFDTLSTSPITGKKMNTLIGTRISKYNMQPEAILRSLLVSLLVKKNGEALDQMSFDELYLKMENFFYEDKIKFRYFAPISNIKVEKDRVELATGLSIVKISKEEKELLLSTSNAFNTSFPDLAFRTHALEYVCEVQKLIGEQPSLTAGEKFQPDITRDKFNEVIAALRLFKSGLVGIGHIWALNLGWSLYGGTESYFLTRGATNFVGQAMSLSDEEVPEFLTLWRHFSKAYEQKRTKVINAIRRLGYGIERAIPEDQIVDYIIGFESLFLNDNDPELSFRLSLFTAHWLGENNEQRKKIFEIMKIGYTQRSNIVHGGKMKPTVKILDAEMSVQEHANSVEGYLRDACKKFVAECAERNINEAGLITELKEKILK